MSLTLQQVFDNQLHGIRKQGYLRSESDLGGCVYHNGDLSCGIGHSLPRSLKLDERPNPNDDGQTTLNAVGIEMLMRNAPDVRDLFAGININTLSELQDCHDELHGDPEFAGINKERFELAMADFADNYGLEYTAP